MNAPAKPPGRFSRRKLLAALLLGGPAVVAVDAAVVEPAWLNVRRFKLRESPSHRLVHFTDLHHKGDGKWLAQVVSRINALAPDAVCFTGDLVEDAEHLPEALALLKEIRAPLYGVPGNHDYWAKVDFKIIASAFAGTGGAWLMDEEIRSRDGKLNFIGATCQKAPWFTPTPGLKNVLLLHYPAWIKRIGSQHYDLTLAGHSHGGQVRLPFVGALLVPWGVDEYEWGLFQTAAGPLYVGAGVGWFYLNLRLNCRPEVTVFEI